MQTIFRHCGSFLLALSCMTLLANTAQAQLSLPEREHVQTVVLIGESLTFITVIAVALFIWRISARSRKNKDRSRTEDKKEG